jgi:hypothetical protein
MSLFNGIPHPIGSPKWADLAEKAEWAFMAQMLKEADDELRNRGFHMSGLGVARDIAEARSESGWRTYDKGIPHRKSETPGTDTKTSGTP